MLEVIDIAYYWLALAAVLLTLEMLGASGIGFLFAGLAAIITAILTNYNIAENWASQTAWFFGLTSVIAVILWEPLKRMKAPGNENKQIENFSNMVGDEAIVISAVIAPGGRGLVKWSGTQMNAVLSSSSPEVALGTRVIIEKVEGTELIVSLPIIIQTEN